MVNNASYAKTSYSFQTDLEFFNNIKNIAYHCFNNASYAKTSYSFQTDFLLSIALYRILHINLTYIPFPEIYCITLLCCFNFVLPPTILYMNSSCCITDLYNYKTTYSYMI